MQVPSFITIEGLVIQLPQNNVYTGANKLTFVLPQLLGLPSASACSGNLMDYRSSATTSRCSSGVDWKDYEMQWR